MSVSLWNIPDGDAVFGPVQIMKEQGRILEEYTSNKLQCTIQTSGNGSDIINEFNIVVPSLGFYSFTVAQYLQSPLAIYPGNFRSQLIGDWVKISDETEFRARLGHVLGSQQASDLIKTLLSQVG